jgi:hypothetical protein
MHSAFYILPLHLHLHDGQKRDWSGIKNERTAKMLGRRKKQRRQLLQPATSHQPTTNNWQLRPASMPSLPGGRSGPGSLSRLNFVCFGFGFGVQCSILDFAEGQNTTQLLRTRQRDATSYVLTLQCTMYRTKRQPSQTKASLLCHLYLYLTNRFQEKPS